MAPGVHIFTTSSIVFFPNAAGTIGTICPAPRNSADSPLFRANESMEPFAASTVRMMFTLSPSGRRTIFTSTSGFATMNCFTALVLITS